MHNSRNGNYLNILIILQMAQDELLTRKANYPAAFIIILYAVYLEQEMYVTELKTIECENFYIQSRKNFKLRAR